MLLFSITIVLLEDDLFVLSFAMKMARAAFSRPRNKLLQALHLFTPGECDEFGRCGFLFSPDHRPEITSTQGQTSQDDRRFRRLIKRPEQFPAWMVSKSVIFDSKFELRLQCTLLGGIHHSMVNAYLIGEGPCLPPFHSRGNDRDMVDSTTFDWGISADRFVALSPEQLAASPDIFTIGKAIVVLLGSFPERRSANAKVWIFAKLAQQILKVIRLNRDIGIKIADHIRIQFLGFGITGVEGVNFPGKMPLRALWHPQQVNPGIVCPVLAYDFVGPI